MTGRLLCWLGKHDYCDCLICMSDDTGRSVCRREKSKRVVFKAGDGTPTVNFTSKLYRRPK